MTNTTKDNPTHNTQASNTKFSLKKLALPLVVAGSMALVSVPVAAKKYRSNANQTFDYAKVTNVNPVYDTYQVNNPVEHCYDEQVRVRDKRRYSRYDSKTPEIVGGIIGGVIGNQVGKNGGGKARDVATVVGAVLGGSIARDAKHNNRNNRYRGGQDRYETVQRCEVRDSYTTRQELVGYDVTYKYRGNIYHSQLNNHPGDRIKVKVTVDPV